MMEPLMTAFAIGFAFMMFFVVMVGVAALVFISFDAQPQPTAHRQPLYTAIRIIDTQEIETTDHTGNIQRWRRSA